MHWFANQTQFCVSFISLCWQNGSFEFVHVCVIIFYMLVYLYQHTSRLHTQKQLQFIDSEKNESKYRGTINVTVSLLTFSMNSSLLKHWPPPFVKSLPDNHCAKQTLAAPAAQCNDNQECFYLTIGAKRNRKISLKMFNVKQIWTTATWAFAQMQRENLHKCNVSIFWLSLHVLHNPFNNVYKIDKLHFEIRSTMAQAP